MEHARVLLLFMMLLLHLLLALLPAELLWELRVCVKLLVGGDGLGLVGDHLVAKVLLAVRRVAVEAGLVPELKYTFQTELLKVEMVQPLPEHFVICLVGGHGRGVSLLAFKRGG